VRIGIFDPYLDTLGGGEKYMLAIASCLSIDNRVDVFWDEDKNFIKKTAEERFGLDLSKTKFVKNIFSSQVSLLNKLFVTRKYDIIIFLSDGSIPLTFAKKLMLHFQAPVERVNSKGFIKNLKLKRVNSVICNSKFTKEYIDKKFGVKSILLYPPVDQIDSSNIKKDNSILTVGRFEKMSNGSTFKKHEVMIEVFKKMVDKGLRGWKLEIVTSVNKNNAQHLVQIENLVNGYPIRILVNLSKLEISELYKKAKIYWHAAGFGEDLQRSPEKAEHFGIATVDAMQALAVPVVIMAGGQIEIVENKKSGFLWQTKEELIEKTNLLIRNNNLLNEMSVEARKRSNIFVGNRFCKEVKEIIKK